MVFKSVLTKNWMTRRNLPGALPLTILLVITLLLSSFFYLQDIFHSSSWMPASGEDVFKHREYWRLWTALLAHADLPHVFSNLVLFIPFSYYLIGYFGAWFFPLIGFFVGGVTNALVIKFLPAGVSLLGASGVVYWMGGAWMTLAFLIDRREKFSRRFIRSLAVSMMLFLPETYRPEVSYLAHFVGFAFGVVSGFGLYLNQKDKFLSAEVVEFIPEEEVEFDWSGESETAQN